MTRELMTSWGEYHLALDRLLALPGRKLRIFDRDLAELQLESGEHRDALTRILHAGSDVFIRIAVRETPVLMKKHPQLLKMASTYGHLMTLQEAPPHLAQLRDSMIILDDSHALIRFEQDVARCKLLIDEPDEVSNYLRRFEEIWGECAPQISPGTLGL